MRPPFTRKWFSGGFSRKKIKNTLKIKTPVKELRLKTKNQC